MLSNPSKLLNPNSSNVPPTVALVDLARLATDQEEESLLFLRYHQLLRVATSSEIELSTPSLSLFASRSCSLVFSYPPPFTLATSASSPFLVRSFCLGVALAISSFTYFSAPIPSAFPSLAPFFFRFVVSTLTDTLVDLLLIPLSLASSLSS